MHQGWVDDIDLITQSTFGGGPAYTDWRTTYSDSCLLSWPNLSCHSFILNQKYFYTSHSVSRTLIYEWRSAKISTETASYWFLVLLFFCFYYFKWLKPSFIAQLSTEHRFARLHLGPLPLLQTLQGCHSQTGSKQQQCIWSVSRNCSHVYMNAAGKQDAITGGHSHGGGIVMAGVSWRTWSCPLAIGSPELHINATSERGLVNDYLCRHQVWKCTHSAGWVS